MTDRRVIDDPEGGFTLTEVLAALLILAIAITAIVAAMGSSIIASDVHRKLVDEDSLLRSYSEALLNPAHWKPTGHECPSAAELSPGNVGVQLGNWPGYAAEVESIEFWQPVGDPPAASPLEFSPNSQGDSCDQGTARAGLERITIKAWATTSNRSGTHRMTILVRRP